MSSLVLDLLHSYENDTQVYISAPVASSSSSIKVFVECVESVDDWMFSNRLRINADKTQLIWFGTRQQLDKLSTTDLSLQSSKVQFSTTVSNLGVLLDGQLSMVNHVALLCRSCFFQLRQLPLVRSSLTLEAAKTVYAFVSNRLD